MSRRFIPVLIAVALSASASFVTLRAAEPSGATMSRIRQAGHITFGYVTDARPFSYTNDAGSPAGYAVALCEAIAQEVRNDLAMPSLSEQWVPVARQNRFTAVQDGHVDLMCGGDTATLARRAQVAFSIPIFPGGIAAMVRADASARLQDVLAGRGQPFHPVWRAAATQLLQSRDFSVVAGTTAEPWLRRRMTDLDVVATVAPVNGYDAGVERLIARRSDVFFGERAVLLDAARRHTNDTGLLVIDRMFTYEPLALALPRDDEDFRLLVDRALSKVYRSGAIAKVYTTAFGEPDATTVTFFRWNALPE